MPPRSRLRLIPGSKKPDLAAEWIDPKLLVPWKDNPRLNDHVVASIIDSIKTYGFGKPVLARRANREIIAGHATTKAALEMKLDRVPVRFLDISEEAAHKLALADNRLGELAKWDLPKIQRVMQSWDPNDIKRVGWSDKDLKALRKHTESHVDEKKHDGVRSSPLPITQPGDLWRLGRHRLVCGDATNPASVKRAIGNHRPFICITAPPSGTDAESNDWEEAYKLFPGDVAYVWHGGSFATLVEVGLRSCDLLVRSQIVWVKQIAVLGRGAYHWRHEPCWYAVRKGKDAKWLGDRTQNTVWEVANSNPMGGARDDSTGLALQKPVELYTRALYNHGDGGDVLYEPFCGSGTGIIAAEQTDRVCCALELVPERCDVIIDRWQRLTGGQAKRSGG